MTINLGGFVRKKTTIVMGTEEFTFTELNLADLAEFRAHLAQQREELCEKRRIRLIEDASRIKNINAVDLLKVTDSTISEEEVEAQTYTVEGIGYLAYLSLRYSHSGINLKQVMNIITLEHIEAITKAMFPVDKADEIKKKLAKDISESPK